MADRPAAAEQVVVDIPYDAMNEQLLLAAAMAGAGDELLRRLRPDSFQDPAHQAAWAAARSAAERGLTCSPEVLAQLAGGRVEPRYLRELAAVVPATEADLDHHAGVLLWDAARARAARGPLGELLRALQDPATPPERVRALARQVPAALEAVGGRQQLLDGRRLVAEQERVLAERCAGLACYPTGIDALDRYGPNDVDEAGNSLCGQPLLVPGLAPGQVTTVTAISGGGKSTLAALIALWQARLGRRVLYGAWEMGGPETLELMACISAEISRMRARTGRLTEPERLLLGERMRAIERWVDFVDLPYGRQRGERRSHDEVLDAIHGYVAASGCQVAVFDLWRRAFRRLHSEDEEAEALYRQQAIAAETQTHVILCQQQRLKDVEQRANPRPTREGIKGSSAWVDVSDTIIRVYLPGLLKRVGQSTVELLVLKQRYGRWPLAVEHDWDGDLVRLSRGRVVAYNPGSEQVLGPSPAARAWSKGGR